MQKLSKLSPYAKSYLVGAGTLGLTGAAGGAALQMKGTLQGDQFKKMSPAERKARIRRQRTIGALGGAAKGLALNHMAMNTFLGTGSVKKDMRHIAGAAGLGGLVGGYADYKRLDDAALRGANPKMPHETKRAYNDRLKAIRIGQVGATLSAAASLGAMGAEQNMAMRQALRSNPGIRGYGGIRDVYNDVFKDGFRQGFKNLRNAASGAASGAGGGGGGASGFVDPLRNAQNSTDEFLDMTEGFGMNAKKLRKELKKAKSDPEAARQLRKKLKKTYRAAAMKAHPDRGGDEAVFKKLDGAYRNMDDFLEETLDTLEKKSSWLRMQGHEGFYEKIAHAANAQRYQTTR